MDGKGISDRPDIVVALIVDSLPWLVLGAITVLSVTILLRRLGATASQSVGYAWLGTVVAAVAMMFFVPSSALAAFSYMLATPVVLLLIWGWGRPSAYREPRRW